MKMILQEVANAASQVFEVTITPEHLTGRGRKREFVMARQVFCQLMREFTAYSLGDIGRMLGRDHATVIHSIKVFTQAVGGERILFDRMTSLCKAAVIHHVNLEEGENKLKSAILLDRAEQVSVLKEELAATAERKLREREKHWNAQRDKIRELVKPENKCPGWIRFKIEKVLAE